MSRLFEIASDFEELFNEFEKIENYEFNTDADGNTIDDNGNIIENPDAFKDSMLQAWFDTLEGIECEFKIKAENIAVYIKNLTALAKAIDAEEKALKLRKEQKNKQIERFKSVLKSGMDLMNITKIDMPKAKINIRNNAESTIVENESDFIKWAEKNRKELLKYREPEVKKTEVKKLIQAGKYIPFAHLERSRSLIIK